MSTETDEHKYARHTRNAVVVIAALSVLGFLAGIILAVVVGMSANQYNNQYSNPTPAVTCSSC